MSKLSFFIFSLGGFLLVFVMASQRASAVVYRIDSSAGLMQQPSSQYYHYTYGGSLSLGIESYQAFMKVNYFERPKFESNGFEDQDYGTFLQFGKKVNKAKWHGLVAYFGYGVMQGHVKKDGENSETRRYELEGFTLTLEYEVILKSLRFALNHQTFVGIASKSDLEAYVAWPFNMINLSMGVEI